MTNSVKDLKAQLAALNGTLSTADLFQSLSSIEAEKTTLVQRLKSLSEGDVKPVDQTRALELEAELAKWKGIEMRRRKIRDEMWKIVRDLIPEGHDEVQLKVCGSNPVYMFRKR